MTHALPEKPEVLAIAGKAGMGRFEVVGRLFTMWRWFDLHTTEGNAVGVTKVTLSECLFGYSTDTKFVDAVISEGWLIEDSNGIRVKNFDAHISESAKTRAQTAKRVAKSKAMSGNGKGNGNSVTETLPTALPREEKRREVNTSSVPDESEPFKAFWQTWPKSVRKVAKGECWKLWRKNRFDSVAEQILANVEAMKKTEQWRTGYDPAPAVYLRNRRWEGAELPPAAHQGAQW